MQPGKVNLCLKKGAVLFAWENCSVELRLHNFLYIDRIKREIQEIEGEVSLGKVWLIDICFCWRVCVSQLSEYSIVLGFAVWIAISQRFKTIFGYDKRHNPFYTYINFSLLSKTVISLQVPQAVGEGRFIHRGEPCILRAPMGTCQFLGLVSCSESPSNLLRTRLNSASFPRGRGTIR